MLVATVQFDVVWVDKPANHAIVERMLRKAKIEQGTYVILPELGDTGFSFDLTKIVDGLSLSWARSLARELGIWIQPGFAENGNDGRGRNLVSFSAP